MNNRYTLSIIAALALAGCGQVSGPVPTGGTIPTGAAHGKSWMLVRVRPSLQGRFVATSWVKPGTSSVKKLIYISSLDQSKVLIFNYDTGAAVGSLSGFWNPQGQCVDAKGDVFIADYSNLAMVEYAHGGSKPIKTLQTHGSPIACSVSADGDLAAVYGHTERSNQSEVVIFKDASGTPTVYKNTKCYYLLQPGYDHEGNLYVQANTYKGKSDAEVCRIPKSGKAMAPVSSNAHVVSPQGLMWDGQHIALSGDIYSGSGTYIFQMKEMTSGSLVVVSKTTLGGNTCTGTLVQEPFIVGARNTPVNTQVSNAVVGADFSCSKFYFWPYPKSGIPFKALKRTLTNISGQSVSIAP